MPVLADRLLCSGCTACYSICHSQAISMIKDIEGFQYPSINKFKCINCGLCEKVCPCINRDLPREPLAVYAAQARDDKLRLKSSSGGIFSLIARQVISHGGIVFGAGFDYSNWTVKHIAAENECELNELRGSKYVQSNLGDTFKIIKNELLKEREVLFVGTPCQVAGIRHYLSINNCRQYHKLLLVDLVCHAVPSPLAWKRYLETRIKNNGQGSGIKKIFFRQKIFGWKRYSLQLIFNNGNEYLADVNADTFLLGFLSELYNRPSCHNCSLRELRSGSDITIADYWNVSTRFPEFDDDLGTSLVLVNSKKGEIIFNNLDIKYKKSEFKHAININHSIIKSDPPNSQRPKVMKSLLHKNINFDSIVNRILIPLHIRIRRNIGAWIRRIGIIK